jgi:hypothetical protein
MKRILVKENSNARKNSPRIALREGKGLVFDLNTKISSLRKLVREGNRLAADLNDKINSSRKPLREGERSTIETYRHYRGCKTNLTVLLKKC